MPINALANFLHMGILNTLCFEIVNRKNIILVSGRIGSGKSNTIARIYLRLCQRQPNHSFNGTNVLTPQISSIPIQNDFFAIFEAINCIKVAVISAGDSKIDFENLFNQIKNRADVFICASRLIENENSVFRYITTDLFNEGILVDLNFGTFPNHTDNVRQNMQNSIANAVMQHLDNVYFNNQ